MSVSELSSSTQNYLKVIWGLSEWSEADVTPTAIASKTGLKLSTVSDAVRKLAGQGLVNHTPYGAVRLTDVGRSYAVAMVRRHRLLESFLVEALGYRWDQVHDEADSLEHAVSDFMIDRIDERLGRPERDPHGDPIPHGNGDAPGIEAVRLTEAPTDSDVVVERISDADPHLLRFCEERRIGVGTRLRVQAGAPFSDSLEVHIGDSSDPVALGRSATDSLFVSPCAS